MIFRFYNHNHSLQLSLIQVQYIYDLKYCRSVEKGIADIPLIKDNKIPRHKGLTECFKVRKYEDIFAILCKWRSDIDSLIEITK